MTAKPGIIPRPKRFKLLNGTFPLTAKTVIVCAGSGCRQTSEECADNIKRITGLRIGIISQKTSLPKNNVILVEIGTSLPEIPDKKEGYLLKVTPERVTVKACSETGLFYALQSLFDLLEKDENRWYLPACDIKDWPDFSWRGFLVDPARKFIPADKIRAYIDIMSRNKMNVFHLHFSDNECFTLGSEKFPALNERLYHEMIYGTPRRVFTLTNLQNVEKQYAGVYSRKDIKNLVQYARDRMVNILPEITMPSHAAPILKTFPELKCRVKEGYTSETVMCLGNEKTYEILGKIIDEFAPLFPFETFHIGCDEIDCRDVLFQTRMFYAQRWDVCEVCKARMQEQGFTNVYQLFYYFARRVQHILAKHGKRLMMWNDFINIAEPQNIPEDTLIHYWRIPMKNRGPRKGHTFAKFLKEDFQVVNSNAWDAYIDDASLMKEKNLAGWNPASRPFSPPELRKQIIGSELCAWADWEHYPRTVPPGMALFADRVWNKRPVKNLSAFSEQAARHLFGPHLPSELKTIFQKLGCLIPPRKNGVRACPKEEMTMPEHALKTKVEYKKLGSLIEKTLKAGKIENRTAMEEYLKTAKSSGTDTAKT